MSLQIPNHTEKDMKLHFMDGVKNWEKIELERRHVKTIDKAITEVESFG